MAFVRTLPGADRYWNALAAALLLGVAVLIGLTFTDYGVTWDEDVHNWYGYFALDYYLSFFADQRALNWLNLYNYGAAFDMIAAAFNKFSPLGIYETRHLLNGLVGLVGLAGYTAFVPLYVRHIGLHSSRLVFLVYGCLILVVRIAGARLPDRLGPVRAGTGALGFGGTGLLIVQSPTGVLFQSVGGQ